MILYDDLLAVPYLEGGRDARGMDCYGLVIECCKRSGTPIKDLSNIGHVDALELPRYVRSVNARHTAIARPGNVVQCEYAGELHIGYMLDKKRVLHMTYEGVRATPLLALRNAKMYEVIND